ncbi:cytochrome c [Vibrio nitrifigilis]|nr:cytochrome c [Vibrio nitrifigilis]
MKVKHYLMIVVLLGLAVVAAIVSGVLAPKTVNPPKIEQLSTTEVPKGMSRGEYIAKMSDCTACHTTQTDKPFAGGLAMPLPMGTLYSTNITPDKETGIGRYTLADFRRVLREGIRKDGSRLYPAMPYTEYTKLSDADIESLYDYFMNQIKPVHQANRENDIPAVMSMRWPLALWNWMFHKQGAYRVKPDESAQWNRGAYLVQGATHCGTCHTPRGLAMQSLASDETEHSFLAGSDLGGWHAFNITSDETAGIGKWSQAEIVQYLKTGSVPGKAQAAGPMAEAVEHSFQYLTDSDLNSIATYLRSVTPFNDDKNKPSRFEQGQPVSQDLKLRGVPVDVASKKMPGASLYMGNCSVCHDADGSGSPDGYYPSLYHNSVIGSEHTGNLIQVILHGVKRHTASGDVMMPAFGQHLSDKEVATLVNFLTKTYGAKDANISASDVKALRVSE